VRRLAATLCLFAIALHAQDADTKSFTTESGLKVEVLTEGEARTAPKPGDRVKVHYTGWLTDGTKFDSSVDRGEPIEIVVGVHMVIDGWDEGLALMNVGSKCKLTIPWTLAYGEKGRGEIPPKADLVFEVELLEVVPGERVPEFRQADPEQQKTTESGLKWETLVEGSGDQPGADDVVKVHATIWTTEGKLAFSWQAIGQPLAGQASELRLTRLGEKFLPEAIQLMKPGGSYRFEVPAALCWGEQQVLPDVDAPATTVWQLDFDKIVRFETLDPEKTTKTASGLEYEVLKEGTGSSPGPNDSVSCHYAGWFEDGKEFDSSYRRGQPAQFPLARVIKGWMEGLQLMKEGGIYRFRIPPDIAYGPQGKGPIPPNSTLVFEVELLRVLGR